MNDGRATPDSFLSAARAEGRGKLKIFLGAAPGVGKTFEMLVQGAALLHQGRDVVVGVVESHGRAETLALVAPFEQIPQREIAHGAHVLREFDLDAMLARRPQIALIDELAHSNVPGSRHLKRWQDIEELRDAGIDVFTTLNIQHIESLNDVVAGFTRVRVRETVPDAVLDDAELEVIDLPPDELIVRLQDGKVYIPEEATRALGHFFSKANLSALRELVLRRAAQTVDRQMLDHVALVGESGAWAAGERLVVAIDGGEGSEILVRAGKRLADALHAPWTVLTIETPRRRAAPDGEAQKLAARLGARLANAAARSVPRGLVDYARETRATVVVLGLAPRSRARRSWRGTVSEFLAANLPDVALHVVPVSDHKSLARPDARPWPWRGVMLALLGVALTTAVNLGLLPLLGADPIDLLYLVPVILSATIFGLRPALVAAFAAATAYNFFFLQPTGALTISDPRNAVTFVILAGVGVVAAQLAGRLRGEANLGARNAVENAAIAAFGQRLASVTDEADTARVTCEEVSALLGVATVVLKRGDDGVLRTIAAHPTIPSLSPVDIAAAEYATERGVESGRDTATLAAADWQFHPLKTALGVLAVLGIGQNAGGDVVAPGRRLLLTTLTGQAALAQERLELEARARSSHAAAQRDDLRVTLVAALGHDLKTPLTAVVAAADALAAHGGDVAEAAILRAAARRLSRRFDDLVGMTRLESGEVAVRAEPVDLTDAAVSAVHDMKGELARHRLVLAVPPSLPLVVADPLLLHHALVNLLDNAAKYAPEGSVLTIEGRRTADGVTLSLLDEGPGLPADGEALFQRFHRGTGSDRRGGTGLGLAIVRGFAEAMGLTVSAANRTDRSGACITIRWPATLVRAGGEG